MDTECTYDYLFVYDGDSYQSPLIASLSGNTLPQPIEAKSGKVTVSNMIFFKKYSKNGKCYTCVVLFNFLFRCCFISSVMLITTSWASMQPTPSPYAPERVVAMVDVNPPH